jgi:hypothetical protein
MSTAKAITNDIVQNTSTQRTIFRILIVALILLSVIYVYLIGSMTFNILARKSLDVAVRSLGDQVSSLELTDLNQSNSIDKAYALSQGFVDAQQNIFATRDTAVRVAIR